ncbi:nuclear transport factor 2 family protein [Aureivirga sp. CE67]|uniref:nuclear transport factor 2 family protein n=1 Tax=Aureivirga sp. CE67 TaxID=1788983 RepID=UPI0018CA31BD|nr:nuclear transport factor 2 family protein [Aureivirga sp. CE67]
MKKIIYVLVISFVALTACTEPATKKYTKAQKAEIITKIDTLLNQWHRSAADALHQDYIQAMSKDGVYIGTDASENWTRDEFEVFSKPYFDKNKTWDFKTLTRNIYVGDDGKYAWFDELLDTKLGVCRGSGVVYDENGKWEIKHYVLSIAVPNENLDKIIPINKGKDSLIIQQYRNE